MQNKIAVIDFGGQYAHLIANRIRRIGVFSEIIADDTLSKKHEKGSRAREENKS
ncbi:hypothetical protein KKG71_00850 [Patescibacteria group bacterium]|nr:hypothetical protein [Patescibacteria group bacterium]